MAMAGGSAQGATTRERLQNIQDCGLIIYGDVQATLVAAEPMTEQAWREIINSAAQRCDAVRDNGAPPETPTEATAIEDGLAFLICHRRPDITNADDFIMLAPELPGW